MGSAQTTIDQMYKKRWMETKGDGEVLYIYEGGGGLGGGASADDVGACSMYVTRARWDQVHTEQLPWQGTAEWEFVVAAGWLGGSDPKTSATEAHAHAGGCAECVDAAASVCRACVGPATVPQTCIAGTFRWQSSLRQCMDAQTARMGSRIGGRMGGQENPRREHRELCRACTQCRSRSMARRTGGIGLEVPIR